MDLQEAIKKTRKWYEMHGWHDKDREVINKFGDMFHPNNLDKLGKKDFKSFLLYRNNKHWWGIARHGNEVTQNMANLRQALEILLDEKKPLEERLDVLFPKDRPNYIKGLGRAVVTPILMVVYPTKYGVYNSKTEQGLRKAGLLPKFGVGASFSESYIKINKVLSNLASQNGMSLFELDAVWWNMSEDPQG